MSLHSHLENAHRAARKRLHRKGLYPPAYPVFETRRRLCGPGFMRPYAEPIVGRTHRSL